MTLSKHNFRLVILSASFAALLTACGGGGGGGSGGGITFNGGSWESDFFLEDIFFGRPVFDAAGVASDVVNPASYIELDPITGTFLAGYPRMLFSGDDPAALYSLNLVDTSSQPFEPKIVPRNAAFVVVFSKEVDASSLNLDANRMLTANSPIVVQDKQGRSVPLQVTVQGEEVILNPLTGDNVGFRASPVIYDESGTAVADPVGFMSLTFYSKGTGPNVLVSEGGLELGARYDHLGTPVQPVGFNPGNRELDFLSFGDLTFNGFLPDLTPPRIIREVKNENAVSNVTFDFQFGNVTYIVIEDSAASFNTTANEGGGEWGGRIDPGAPPPPVAGEEERLGGAVLTITRPGSPSYLAKVRVYYNTATELYVKPDDAGFGLGYPEAGDEYLVQRVEYFEPIADFGRPETAIDPEEHPLDPDDPEDAFNMKLIYFMQFDEWNGSGWTPVVYPYGQDPNNPIDPKWRFSFQFSEPMDIDSFRPYETFYVADDIGSATDPLFNAMKIGRVTAGSRQTRIYFEPVHIDQFGLLGGDVFRGFGSSAKDLRCVLRIVPPPTQVDAFYESLGDPGSWPPEVVADLEEEGVLGVTDLGGQPVGMPAQFFDKSDPYCIINGDSPGVGAFPPAVDYKIKLACGSDPILEETGVIVHRFMGLPETAADPSKDPPITGVVFRDHDDGDDTHGDNEIYGPHIADVHIGLSGFLSGHPVEFIEHVFDDYNPPPPSSPSYPDPISRTPFGAGTPINASYGVRFQHIYRRGEASPDVPAFQGTILDLIGMAWSPIGGNVTHTYIKEMAIAMSLCSLGIDLVGGQGVTYDEPDTRESGGIPTHKASGLEKKYDSYRGTWGPGIGFDQNYKEENPPISGSNVFDSDGDQSMRDEWHIVLGSDIDFQKLHANPVTSYADGRPYIIDQKNVFAPQNQGSRFNYYISYPDFDNPGVNPGYGYDSSRGLLIDIRTDHNGDTSVALTNGYAFHVGIQSSMLPRFRVYARAYASIPRTRVFAATDPFDEVDPPKDQFGFPNDTWSWNRAWDTMLAQPGSYGDNSRYFMIFNYAKRVSTIESPLLRVRPTTLMSPEYLAPIVWPAIDDIPQGTTLSLWFRASFDANGSGLTENDWVLPESIGLLNGSQRPYNQFRATFEANLSTGDVPAIDTIIIPYKK